MKHLRETLYALLASETGHIQLFIAVPIITLALLSVVVRTASSAVDPTLEKKKVAEQLRRRLNEVQQRVEYARSAPIVDTTPPQLLWQVNHKVTKKTSIESVLDDEIVNRAQANEWITAARAVREFTSLHPGRTLTLSFAEKEEEWELATLSYAIDQRSVLLLERKADHSFNLKRENIPTTVLWHSAGGRIEDTLSEAASRVGVPSEVIDGLGDLDWDIDLSSDLRAGDTFKVIFEEFQRNGKTVEYGRILAAEIINKGKPILLFPSSEKEQQTKAQVVGQAFLRYPLQFTQITSVFTEARFHPILKQTRPHLGVDFAAPAGTPIRTIAGGTVSYAGRYSGYGNYILIDHSGPYESAYAHLQRIAKEVTVGATVERGQVIGYVGSTGWATGPHLHFELHKDGCYVNPLTAKLPVEDLPMKLAQKRSPRLTMLERRLTAQLAVVKIGEHSVAFSVTQDILLGRSLRSS